MELVVANAIKKWRQLIGPTDSAQARVEAPDSLRAHFGRDKTHNACHGSDAPETAQEELQFFFGPGQQQVCADAAWIDIRSHQDTCHRGKEVCSPPVNRKTRESCLMLIGGSCHGWEGKSRLNFSS